MIRLRPHHALCLQTYIGKGYSDAFTENMDKLATSLRRHPFQQVIFTFGADDICAACPNLHRDQSCEKEAACAALDEAVGKALCLGCTTLMTWADATALVEKSLLQNGAYRPLCEGCMWEEICRLLRQKRGICCSSS